MTPTASLDTTLDVLCCTHCRSELAIDETTATCRKCGRKANRLDSHLWNFLPIDESEARGILGWPEPFVERLGGWYREATEAPSGEFRDQLLHYGLIRPDGEVTDLGFDVRYHISEFRWQTDRKGFDGLLDLGAFGPNVKVLDVGCGAGQTLRRLEADRSVELTGADVNINTLALGYRFARQENLPITLTSASAHALPFRDESFDLVIARGAINYMHQKTSVSEMARVLKPGGTLFCRVEHLRHDLAMIARSRTAKGLICRTRDFAYGLVHATTGLQPIPGSLVRGGRAFASRGRLARILKPYGCKIVKTSPAPNGPIFLGGRTQFLVVARKEPTGA